MMAASLAALLFGGAGHVFAQRQKATPVLTEKTAAAQQDPDLQAIRDNILTVKGMKFPKLPPSANAKTGGQSCCTMGDTRSHEAIRFYHEEEGVKPKGKVTYEGTTPYSPPSTCWVISTYNLTVVSANHASYQLTAVPGGYSFVTSNQNQQIYQDLKNFVLNMNILDKYKIEIIANLQQFTNNYAAYMQSLNVNYGSLLLYVKEESPGKYNGRAWFEGIVNVTETCCPPEIQDPLALKTALTTWVNNTVNALPNKGKGLNPRDIKILSIDAAQRENLRANPEPSSSPTPR
jgi:hypothetical protein